jgi:hypothetical protein
MFADDTNMFETFLTDVSKTAKVAGEVQTSLKPRNPIQNITSNYFGLSPVVFWSIAAVLGIGAAYGIYRMTKN